MGWSDISKGRTKEMSGKAAFAVLRPGKFMEAKAAAEEADRNRADAERFRQEGMDLAAQLNWEPDLISDIMPAYRKAESPVARSFLESLLTGANPSSIPSTRLGADRLQRGAQARFDAQTGGWDELLARQRQLEQETPWAPGTYGGAPAVIPLGGINAGPRVGGEVPRPTSAPGWGGVGGQISEDELRDRRIRDLRRMTGA